MRRAGANRGKSIEPCGVRKGRGVEHCIVVCERVHVGEIAHGHRREVPVAEHHPLGTARRARRVEQPREVFGAAGMGRGEGGKVEERREFRAVDGDRIEGAAAAGETLPVGGADEKQIAPGVVEDPFRFAGMQFRVDRQHGGAGPPGRLHRHEIRPGIRHVQTDAVARGDAVARPQPGRQRAGVGGETAIVAKRFPAAQKGGGAGTAMRCPLQPQRDVHVPPPVAACPRRRLSARIARYCRTIVAEGTIRCRPWESSGRPARQRRRPQACRLRSIRPCHRCRSGWPGPAARGPRA